MYDPVGVNPRPDALISRGGINPPSPRPEAPKGRDIPAQGNALGGLLLRVLALKGRDIRATIKTEAKAQEQEPPWQKLISRKT
jgi:hypothetical protein